MTKHLDAVIYELTAPRQLSRTTHRLDIGDLAVDQIAARTIVSAISPGTEVAAYSGAPPLRPSKVYPRLIGYCNIAEVIAVGSAVKSIAVGDRIATSQSHRSAFICKVSDVMATIPADMDIGEAATTYLFHLGYNAILRCNVQSGHNVAVVGLGTLGLATAAVAYLGGARVFGFSNQKQPNDMASFGLDRIFRKDAESALSSISEATNGTGIDVVITTSNAWDDWLLALQLTRIGGVIGVIGFPGRGCALPPFNPLDSQYLYDKQLSIVACGYSPDHDLPVQDMRHSLKRNYRYLLDALRCRRLPGSALISETVSWEDLDTIYKRMDAHDANLRTCILRWT